MSESKYAAAAVAAAAVAAAAIYMGANKQFEVREYPVTAPAPGSAALSLIASGVCGTDVHILRGRLAIEPPKVIGHEFVGRVEQISVADSSAFGIYPGDAAIIDIACPCGECVLCHEGDDANCVNMQVTNSGDPDVPPHFHGGFGEYSYAPIENLVKIPDGIDPFTAAVFACAGPTALHAFRLGGEAGCDLSKVKVAVVQGLGPVGMFAVMYLASRGVQSVVTLTRTADGARAALARRLGATETLALSDGAEAATARIRALGGGLGADLAFEASGSPDAIGQGITLLRNRGVYLIPGQYSDSGSVAISPQLITFGALRLIGSSQYSMSDVRAYLDFLSANPGLHPIIKSLASAYPLREINRAFADHMARKNIKTLLV